jgi:hypothetical protein
MEAQIVGHEFLYQDPSAEIAQASRHFLETQGQDYLQHAQAEAPVGQTQQLRDTQVLDIISDYEAAVIATQPYAIFVFMGTRPHWPPASSGLSFPARRSISIHGTRANPWMDRAFEAGNSDLDANIEALADAIVQGMI